MARFNVPITQLMNNDGSNVATGWKLNFYVTGTTTRKDTFSDSALTAANANPVVADSAGRFGNIFLEAGTYRVILTDADDVEIWDADPVEGTPGSSGAVRSTAISEVLTISDATKLIDVDTSGGAKTITLLPAATAGDGFEVGVRKNGSDVNAVTVDADGAETINGTATRALYRDGETEWYRTNGTEWFVTRKFIDPGKWTDIASAATTNLAVANGSYGDITGTATITALGTAPAGTVRTARTASTPTFTHNATSLILPTGANIIAEAGDVFEFTSLGSGNWICTDVLRASGQAVAGLPRGSLGGCTLSNDTDTAHDINVTVGAARNADNDGDLVLSSEITKQIDATWAAGDDAGGLSSSLTAPANTTWYHVFLIRVAGSVDVGFDTSVTAANLIADHSATDYRRIGSVLTDGSANILAFVQTGDRFRWADPPLDLSSVSITTTASLEILSTPLGVKCPATINLRKSAGSGLPLYVSPPDVNDEAVSTTAAPLATMGDTTTTFNDYVDDVMTDTSSQVRMRSGVSTNTVSAATLGWTDRRGKDD